MVRLLLYLHIEEEGAWIADPVITALLTAGVIGFFARIFSVLARASDLADRIEALIVLLGIASGGAAATVIMGEYIAGVAVGVVGSAIGLALAEPLVRFGKGLSGGFRF